MRRARIEFGGIESHKDAMRASLGLRLWGELCADLHYAERLLRKSPGFTVIAGPTNFCRRGIPRVCHCDVGGLVAGASSFTYSTDAGSAS